MPAPVLKAAVRAAGTAYFTNVVALLFLIACLVTFGYLSDVVGRKPIMIACSVLFLVLPVPAFMIMELSGALLLIVGQAMIGLAQAAGNSIASVVMVEQFPTRIRYTAASSSYNLALMLIGGTAPYVATYLVASTGNNLAPAFYVSVIALLSLGAILLLPETYRVGLLREGDV